MSWNTLGRRPCMDKVHWYQQSRAEIPRNALAFKYVGFCGCHLLEIINTLNACRECQTLTWQKWETDGGWRASPQALNQELVDNANSQLWERSIEAAGRQLSESFSEGESLQTTETSTLTWQVFLLPAADHRCNPECSLTAKVPKEPKATQTQAKVAPKATKATVGNGTQLPTRTKGNDGGSTRQQQGKTCCSTHITGIQRAAWKSSFGRVKSTPLTSQVHQWHRPITPQATREPSVWLTNLMKQKVITKLI